jgi:hypothetical protein
MNAATERMIEVLRARDWKFEVDEKSQMISTGCNGDNGQWRIRAGGLRDIAVLILSRFPVNCPEAKRNVCAELFTRINFGATAVTFEMDYRDGEMFCKTSVPYGKELPQIEFLDKLFTVNLSAMDRHLPVIMSVIYAGISPTRALAAMVKAENQTRKAKAKLGKRKLAAQARFQMN